MTLTAPVEQAESRDELLDQQHIALDGISWTFYEQVLREIGNRPIRVTYCDGSIEIMAPLSEHEHAKTVIGRLLENLAYELNLPLDGFGSTTYRSRRKKSGLEPDECYYTINAAKVRGMKRFDPKRHPPPDLAIEIDITSRSIPRQPIYARLGVPELWRFDGERLEVLMLGKDKAYHAAKKSAAFPFLPLDRFTGYIVRMMQEDQLTVLRDFRDWVKSLKQI